MKNKIIFDASALLCALLKEDGSNNTKKLLLDNSIVMSSVNVAEVISVLSKHGINTNTAALHISDITTDIVAFDLEQATLVGELFSYTKKLSLSLGDRACLALGQVKQFPIYTTDKIWQELDLTGITINLIR